MIKEKLTNVISKLESGARPKGEIVFENGIPSIGGEHLDKNGGFNFSNVRYISKKYFESLSKGLVLKDDILIVKDGATTGKVCFVSTNFPFKNATINEHVFKLEIDSKKAFAKYVFYYLFSEKGQNDIMKDFRGATIGGISRSFSDKVFFPLPPLPEQKRIATILDKADALRQKNKQLLAAYDELLQATFLDMFGDPVTNPKGWEKERLYRIAKLERGRFSPRPRNDPSYFNGIYPFIQTGDISKSGNRLDSYSQTLNEKGIKVSKLFIKGTIVIAIVGATIGATAILKIDVYATDSIIGISVNQEVANNVFLEFVMQFWKPILLKNAPEAARANINLDILGKLDIIAPPIALQNQFSQITENIEAQKAILKQSFQESEDLFNGLVQKAFNGELN